MREFADACVDVPRFHALCRACPAYGLTWSCPPSDFDAAKLWEKYDSIALFGRKFTLSKEARAHVYTPDDMTAAAKRLLAPVKHQLTKDLLKLESQTPGSLALLAGRCEHCKRCARLADKPCIHPDRMRYSIEALGGNVSAACEKHFGIKLLWAENGKLPAYFFLLGGLLKNHSH